MTINFKTTLATGAAIASLLLNTTSVFAASQASSEVLGDGSATVSTSDSDNLSVGLNNGADVDNFDLGLGISGGNSIASADDSNSATSLSATGNAESNNFANSNYGVIAADDEVSSDASAKVGEDGNATATATDIDSMSIGITNGGELDNATVGFALSGFNSVESSDDGNSVGGGSALASAETLNELNSNWLMLEGSHSAYATAEVGDDGSATANTTNVDTVSVGLNNGGTISNLTLAAAVSGGNSISNSDDGNSATGGNATADSNVNNYLNSNVVVVGGATSTHPGAESTAEVGEDGSATATANDTQTVSVGVNNGADIENVNVSAGVSGGNSIENADDGNSVNSGAASGNACSTNTVNSNWIVIGGQAPQGGDSGCN